MTGVAIGPLSVRLAQICDRVKHPAADAVKSRLTDPCLRVVVAGRLNAGKSTLVNALLRHSVAAVDAGECTKVTTWFQYGAHEGAVAELQDGSTLDIPLSMERRLPTKLPVDHAAVRRLVVSLSNDTLRTMTLIDTPGMDTTTEGLAASSESVLGIADHPVAGEADAVIYLMPHLRATDVDRLERLRHGFGPGPNALATIGVLTKTDRLATEDPLATAAALAAGLAAELRGLVTAVIPVVGLLGETADADGLTEHDAHVLRLLVDLEPGERVLALSSAQRFLNLSLPGIAPAQLQRLMDRLDMFGLRRLTDDADIAGAAALSRRLRLWSGIDVLRVCLEQILTARADLLRAHSALRELRKLAWRDDVGADQRRELLDGIDAVEAANEYHPWHEARALAEFAESPGTGDAALDQEALRVLRAIDWRQRLGVEGVDDDTTRARAVQLALDGYRRWTEILNSPQSALVTRRVAEVIRRSYLLSYREVDAS